MVLASRPPVSIRSMMARCIPVIALVLAACAAPSEWDDDAVRLPNWPCGYVVGGCGCWTVGLRPPDGPNDECASRYVTAAPCSDPQFVASCRGDAWMMVCA